MSAFETVLARMFLHDLTVEMPETFQLLPDASVLDISDETMLAVTITDLTAAYGAAAGVEHNLLAHCAARLTWEALDLYAVWGYDYGDCVHTGDSSVTLYYPRTIYTPTVGITFPHDTDDYERNDEDNYTMVFGGVWT